MKQAMHQPQNTATQANVNSNALGAVSPDLRLRSPQQAAFLQALLGGSYSLRELMAGYGFNHPNDIAFKLRGRGWKIHTLPETVTTRYGNTTRAGRYELDASQHDYAREAIRLFKAK
ncbi:helix-turn-helix domain-containing protein [Thiomicrospira microaerophila]|uniref:helix-turn-helix domain-containing protein n=1 Tax=Thiomicrospira microaerophila TaxID=406020 RepID=UPI0005C7FED0|nr:helix-turn-helix domain-containing protein [Thiomicrospira microaerophila]